MDLPKTSLAGDELAGVPADCRQNTVAVLPVGAIEQHGPHLPVFVDSCINSELLDRALLAAPPASLPVTALPIQSVGKSEEHIAYPGTLLLSAETLTRALHRTRRECGAAPACVGCCC